MQIVFAFQNSDEKGLAEEFERAFKYFRTASSYPAGVYTLRFQPVKTVKAIGRPKKDTEPGEVVKRPVGRPRSTNYAVPESPFHYRVCARPNAAKTVQSDSLLLSEQEYNERLFLNPHTSCYLIDNRSGEILKKHEPHKIEPVIDMSGV